MVGNTLALSVRDWYVRRMKGQSRAGRQELREWHSSGHGSWVVLSVPNHPEWSVAYFMTLREGELVLGEVRIYPESPPRADDLKVDAITAPGWEAHEQLSPLLWSTRGDDVPFGGLTARILRQIRLQTGFPGGVFAQLDEQLGLTRQPYRVAADKKAPPRPGRRGRADEFYLPFIQAYLAAVTKRSSRPVQDAASRLGYPPSYVRDLLNDARERDLLTRPPPGRAGGRLTPKGEELLKSTKGTRGKRGGRQ